MIDQKRKKRKTVGLGDSGSEHMDTMNKPKTKLTVPIWTGKSMAKPKLKIGRKKKTIKTIHSRGKEWLKY